MISRPFLKVRSTEWSTMNAEKFFFFQEVNVFAYHLLGRSNRYAFVLSRYSFTERREREKERDDKKISLCNYSQRIRDSSRITMRLAVNFYS